MRPLTNAPLKAVLRTNLHLQMGFSFIIVDFIFFTNFLVQVLPPESREKKKKKKSTLEWQQSIATQPHRKPFLNLELFQISYKFSIFSSCQEKARKAREGKTLQRSQDMMGRADASSRCGMDPYPATLVSNIRNSYFRPVYSKRTPNVLRQYMCR